MRSWILRIFPAVASLAQLAERSLRKGKVTCSNPVGGTFPFCQPAPPTLGYALLDLPYSHCVPSQHRSVYFRLCGGLRPIRERKKETPTLWSPAVAQNSTHAPQTAATVPAPPAPAELDRGKDNPHSTAAAEQAATASGGPAAFYLLLLPRLLKFSAYAQFAVGIEPVLLFHSKKNGIDSAFSYPSRNGRRPSHELARAGLDSERGLPGVDDGGCAPTSSPLWPNG